MYEIEVVYLKAGKYAGRKFEPVRAKVDPFAIFNAVVEKLKADKVHGLILLRRQVDEDWYLISSHRIK